MKNQEAISSIDATRPFKLKGFKIATLSNPGGLVKNGIGIITQQDVFTGKSITIEENEFFNLLAAIHLDRSPHKFGSPRLANLNILNNNFLFVTGDPSKERAAINLRTGPGGVYVGNNSFNQYDNDTKHLYTESARYNLIENNQFSTIFNATVNPKSAQSFFLYVNHNNSFNDYGGLNLSLIAHRSHSPFFSPVIEFKQNQIATLTLLFGMFGDTKSGSLVIKNNSINKLTIAYLAGDLLIEDNIISGSFLLTHIRKHRGQGLLSIKNNRFESTERIGLGSSADVIFEKNAIVDFRADPGILITYSQRIQFIENFIARGGSSRDGVLVYGSSEVSFRNNRINNNRNGIKAVNSRAIPINNNEFWLNCTSIRSENSQFLFIANNYVRSSWCLFSGINSNQDSNLSIAGNAIIDNQGAGFFLQQPQDLLFTNNNVFGNTTAVVHQTGASINADGNFWGTPDGPQEGDIIGNVDVDSWLEEPVNLNIAFLETEVYARHGETDSLPVFIQNLTDANDEIALMFNDTKGWLMTESPIYTQFTDSTGFVFDLVFHIPEGVVDSTLVTVTTTSALRNDWEAEGEVVIFSYDPHPALVVVEPDSVTMLQSDSLFVAALVFDQLDRWLDVPVTWSTTAGEVDELGGFHPGEHIGKLTITATATLPGGDNRDVPAEPVSGHATIRVYEDALPLAHIILEPDTTHLMPGQSEVFSYEALCPEGFGVLLPDSNQLWTATGGEINDFGLYVAGEQAGTFEVTLTDLVSELSGTAVVIIAEPPQLPAPPQLLSPADASEELPIPVVFSWTESEDAEFYILEVGLNEQLDDPQLFLGLQDISYSYDQLEPYTTYFWRVFASGEAGVSSPSATWSFTTGDGEVPEVPETLYMTGGVDADAEECFNALQTITVENFVVEPGGSATLIAGENIVMLPGTHIQQGAWMHAYIAPGGPFCGEREEHFLEAEVLAADDIIKEDTTKTKEEETSLQDITQKAFTNKLFTVFPNPTRDLFTIELQQCAEAELMRVEVYNMRGERIITEELTTEVHHTFSLEEQQPGVYLVRVIVGKRMGIDRVVKW